MRIKTILMAGVAGIIIPATAYAQGPAPVIYASDPGEAHPDRQKSQAPTIETLAAENEGATDKIVTAPPQVTQVTTPTVTSGSFDYAANAPIGDTRDQSTATTAPEMLLTYEDVQHLQDAETLNQAQMTSVATTSTPSQPVLATTAEVQTVTAGASPYQQDPIYQVTETTNTPPSATQIAYTPSSSLQTLVEPGDTVYALGRKYGVHPKQIIAANNMQAPYALAVGQILIIPTKETSNQVATNAQPISAPATQPVVAKTEIIQPIPVQYSTTQAQINSQAQTYIVQPGNTLYSISRSVGLDVATIARANGIAAPYTLSIGQKIIIPAGAKNIAIGPSAPNQMASTTATPTRPNQNRNTYIDPNEAAAINTSPAPQSSGLQREAKVVTSPEAQPWKADPIISKANFSWPVQGKVIMQFGLDDNGRRNDGINIAAPVGTPIRAVADGEVVYRGTDLEGYGNLLLVKHDDGWVSAYAHTDSILVTKGAKISKGQVIAKVGRTGAVTQPQLHFELRHDLKPTDPLAVLEGRTAAVSYRVEQ